VPAYWRVLALLALAGMKGAFAQAPAKFVTLDIVALDAHGEAVRDLEPNQIRILDNKQPQSAVFWRSDQRHPDAPRVTVVVFDLSYAGIKSVAWNEAVRTMRQFESSAYLYFYVRTARHLLLPVHELPAVDAESLPANPQWMERTLPPLEATLRFEPPAPKNEMVSFSVYLDLAARLAAFPGRKNLVCVGCLLAEAEDWKFFPTPTAAQVDRATELRQLTEAFHEARVAVYAVGGKPLSGLVGAGNGGASTGGGVTGHPGGLNLASDLIGGVADVTGGRSYTSGQIEEAIRQAMRDGNFSYRLAYLPPPENWDGKMHKIALTSSRAGVRLLSPRWYLADTLEDIARERRPLIPDIAITSPVDQSGITVSVSSSRPVRGAIPLKIHVDAADVLLLPRNGRYSGLLALQAICYTPDQRRQACTEAETARLDLTEQQYQTALRDGLRFPVDVPAGEALSRIRAIVHDLNSGATGSATLLLNEDR
jgi:VWFA-related protein